MTKELKFIIPGEETGGYLKRQQKRIEFYSEYFQSDITERTDLLVDYLCEYLSDENEPEDVREWIWEASETEFNALLAEVGIQFGRNDASVEEVEDGTEVDPEE